jgi:hypothetical protein
MLHRAGRSLGAAALTAALAISRPCAAADSDPPRRIRTGAEILAFLALDFGLLYVSIPAADPPGNVRMIDKLTLRAWSFDASSFATNFLAHPLAGTFFYTTARSNRSAPLESLGWASLASLTWEMAEFRENVSFNDLIVTPIAGASIGEPLVQVSRWLGRRSASPAARALASVLFPLGWLNGAAPTDDGEQGALAADLLLISAARAGSGAELGVRVATRLIHFPGFGMPGEGAQLGFAGNVSTISVDARTSRSGLSHLRVLAGTALGTLYERRVDTDGTGWDLLLSAEVAYDLRQHAWDAGAIDGWSSVHAPGIGFQLRRLAGPLRISAAANVALTFGGARSFLLDAGESAVPMSALTTTQRAWGYTMGWGASAAPSLEVAYGPLSLEMAAEIDTRYGILRPDPWPDRNPSARISDSWSTLRGGAAVKLPWRDLQISASLERNLRRGSAAAYSRAAGETVALVGFGFALR